MKRCYHCKRRILIWQKRRLWFRKPGPSVYLHDNCDTVYDEGYALGKEEGSQSETDNALLCPLMSGTVIVPAHSGIRPAKATFEGNACLKKQCALWVEIDNTCAVTSIAFALLESKMGA